MARYIDADALLSGYDVRKVVEYDEGGWGVDYNAVPVWAIEAAPTIDAEPVRHGRWGFKGTAYGCSLCNFGVIIPAYNYCPNCGARMDGDVNA